MSKLNIAQNLDFFKKSEILNAIIQQITDTTNINNIVDAKGQFAFRTDTNRIVCFDGDTLQELAWKNDITTTTAINMFYQDADPLTDTSVNIADVAIWYSPTTNTLKILKKSLNAWVTISTTNNTSAIIPNWVADTAFINNSIVIYDNKFYQNKTGTDNNDSVWTVGNWTEISGNVVGSVAQTTFAITTSIGDGTTINNVARVGNIYTITHSFNKQFPITNIYDGDNKIVTVDEVEYIDANSLSVTFNKAITENFNVILSI